MNAATESDVLRNEAVDLLTRFGIVLEKCETAKAVMLSPYDDGWYDNAELQVKILARMNAVRTEVEALLSADTETPEAEETTRVGKKTPLAQKSKLSELMTFFQGKMGSIQEKLDNEYSVYVDGEARDHTQETENRVTQMLDDVASSIGELSSRLKMTNFMTHHRHSETQSWYR